MDNGVVLLPVQDPMTCALREPGLASSSPLEVEEWKMEEDAVSKLEQQHQSWLHGEAESSKSSIVAARVENRSLTAAMAIARSSFSLATSIERRDKRPKMELPPFPSLGATSTSIATTASSSEHMSSSTAHNSGTLARPEPRPSSSWPPTSPTKHLPSNNFHGGLAPLTPPQESDSFRWSLSDLKTLSASNNTLSAPQDSSRPEFGDQQQSSATTLRPTTISLPGYVNNMPDQGNTASTWLERAVSTVASSHSTDLGTLSQILMVVQALPSQSKSSAKKAVFEEVVEALQQKYTKVLYMQITHAVPQVMSMEEVPASPPATPNNQQEHDDYFDNHTIYTHASPIPVYHGQLQPLSTSGVKASGLVTAPSSIQVSTLERYIPPTTGQEVDDFWTLSRRSYLVDRMTELSVAGGTLLLIYPTQAGGAVFARQYLGPILDPFVRQFVLLNNLTTNIAAALGSVAAVPHLKPFEDMKERLKSLCQELTLRAPGRGLRGEFKVIHAEKAEVTLDRTTWLGWFIEQESGRMRQNIIDYQKGGGRMPVRGFDASPSSLAREVVDGIKSSRVEAGGVGIEVGVFVIRRSAL